jgi:TIR domain
MPNVFVSYGRESMAIAEALANDIRALGHEAWFDQQLTGGQAWWDEILATVRKCDVFVFVLTPRSLRSTACMSEYGYAAALRKPILPILVADGISTNLLPPALSQIQFVDYRSQDRNAGLRLARALTTIPLAGSLPDPLPAPPDVPISYLGGITEQVDARSVLSYEQQSALVVDLKRGLRDPETSDDARALLSRLRKRRDLLATIADEVDELLRSVKHDSIADRAALDSAERLEAGDDPLPDAAIVAGSSEAQARQFSEAAAGAAVYLAPTPGERVAAAFAGGLLGLVVGLATMKVLDDHTWAWSLVPGGGLAIAAAITGMRASMVGPAIMCAAIGCIVAASLPVKATPWALATMFGLPAGALLGAIVADRFRRRRARAKTGIGSGSAT